MDTFNRSVDDFLLGRVPFLSGPLTICYTALYHVLLAVDTFYKAVDHELLCLARYCTRPLTMRYRALHHVPVDRGCVLVRRGTHLNGSWTTLYRVIDHVIKNSVPYATRRWTCYIGPWNMSYWALINFLPLLRSD